MEKLLKYLIALDWVVAIGSIVVGFWWPNYWLVAGGLFGLGMAYYKPAERIKATLESKLLKKKGITDDSGETLKEEAFYQDRLAAPTAPEEPVAAAPLPKLDRYDMALPAHQGLFLSGNKHNQLGPQHFVLLDERQPPAYF